MALLEGKTPAERRKLIILFVIAGIAALAILYNYVLPSSKKKKGTRTTTTQGSRTTPTTASTARPAATLSAEEIRGNQIPTPIIYQRIDYANATPGRNIFAYYSAPVKPAGDGVAASASPVNEVPGEPTAPTPVPPSIVLASVSPGSVYARTGDFAMQVSGDKFTPETRVYVNGSELPTEFVNNQALRVSVPASMISSEGGRAVIVRTPDGALFSNPLSLNVMPAPAPPFTYVGLIGRRSNDTAVLKERNGELRSVRRDDVVAGRFRVTNISEKRVELTDTELQIKHSLDFVDARTTPGSFGDRPSVTPPRRTAQPDEDTIDEDN